LGFVERCLLAGRVVWFQLSKLIWPANLTFIYPRWSIVGDSLTAWLPLAAVLVGLGLLWRIRHRSRAPLAVALLFVGTLFPVLGFFNVYPFQYSYVADHFQYLASIPVIVGATAAAAATGLRWSGTGIVLRGAAAAALLVALGLTTWRQAHDYHDNATLFRATIARNPDCWMAYNNLGKELMTSKAQLAEAVPLLERAIALKPNYPEAHNNLGLALAQSGRPLEGIPHLEMSLRLKPNSFQAQNNLGIALANSGRAAEALLAFQRAAELNPSLPNIQENWAKALLLLGRKAEADERIAVAASFVQPTCPERRACAPASAPDRFPSRAETMQWNGTESVSGAATPSSRTGLWTRRGRRIPIHGSVCCTSL
jgi:protein O-mannosyl-transferase